MLSLWSRVWIRDGNLNSSVKSLLVSLTCGPFISQKQECYQVLGLGLTVGPDTQACRK